MAAVIVGVLAMGSVASCATPTPSADVSDVTVTMLRSACFGECPVYSVTIHGDGRVDYVGELFVEVTGRQESHIDTDKVAELVSYFYAIDYFSLDDEYKEPITDMPTTTTSITIAGEGRTASVENYSGAPDELKELERRIDEVADTAQWVDRK